MAQDILTSHQILRIAKVQFETKLIRAFGNPCQFFGVSAAGMQ
jgi:hypothetical protein